MEEAFFAALKLSWKELRDVNFECVFLNRLMYLILEVNWS